MKNSVTNQFKLNDDQFCINQFILYIYLFCTSTTMTQIQNLEQIEEIYSKIPKQIIATFKTKLQSYKIEIGELSISTQFNEQALNQLLKSLLEEAAIDQQTLDKLHFQFLIEDNIVRGKLKSHLARYEISCEKTLEIEYILAFEDLELKGQSKEDDWVSTICDIIGTDGNRLGVGLFSGNVSLYNQKNQSIFQFKADEDAIKALKFLPSALQNQYFAITGGISEQLKISVVGFQKQTKATQYEVSNTIHEGSILAIDLIPSLDGHFCSVGSKGDLCIWKVPEGFHQVGNGMNSVKSKKKKRELTLNILPLIGKQENIHEDSIESVCWVSTDMIVTGSSDHSMKIIDVETLSEVRKILTKDSITTSIDFGNDRLLSSHEDGYIRLWDIRDSKNPTHTFKSHSKYASCVQFNRNHQIFASASYDHTVKIWDCRSIFPLQNIGTHSEKVFSVCWKNEKELVSGGSDSKLNFHHI